MRALPRLGALGLIAASSAAVAVPRSTPDLGVEEGRCRAVESGPAFLVSVAGLKDRRGALKLEVYPANDKDFLADDNVLIGAGKTFRRVRAAVPASGTPTLCVRLPGPGVYALMVLHDRNTDDRFNVSSDGVGFAGNPKLGRSKPKAASASARAGVGPARLTVVMNYRRGLMSFGPVRS